VHLTYDKFWNIFASWAYKTNTSSPFAAIYIVHNRIHGSHEHPQESRDEGVPNMTLHPHIANVVVEEFLVDADMCGLLVRL
jgi:hypothetical protein